MNRYKKAIAKENRPESDVLRDPNRKPDEVLRFLKVKEGDTVGEINSGRGYFSACVANVVGKKGKVYAHSSPVSIKRWKGNPIEKRLKEFHQSNLFSVVGEMEKPNFPNGLDKVFNIMTYHDAVWSKANRELMNQTIFNTLISGGIYGILDHNSKEGQGIDNCHDIHRIEKSFVIKEVLSSGFILDSESSILENTSDDCSSMVFEKDIRDKTSRFLLRFRKP
ncbi:MAG: class I SAM-dependent methyltransferase [Gammaproteobacteria bacterium]|jgi:predicted methyltransferase|nr:class I SAM-dependent methyltransferase [Gammaproteobacteria bacterium]